MILYHAITTYHLLECIVHKINFHKHEDAEILVPRFLYNNYEGLKENFFFSNVNVFDWDNVGRNIDGYSGQDVIRCIDCEMKKFWCQDIIDNFQNYFNEINVCSAAYFFGYWLVEKKMTFQWFEEAAGRYSFPEVIMEQDKAVFPIRYELACLNSMYNGNNKYVTKKYVNLCAQDKNVDDPLLEDFNIIQYMKKMDLGEKELIKEFFNVPSNLFFKKNSVLLLTQHFTNLNLLTYNEHRECYQLTLDYFLMDKPICCKLHPSDIMPYEDFLQIDSIINEKFPSELLALDCVGNYDVIASINSTSVYSLSHMGDKILSFNDEYLKTYKQNHKYYFAYKCIKTLFDFEVIFMGINVLQMQNMICFNVNDGKRTIRKKGKLYIVGNPNEEEKEYIQADNSGVFVFVGDYLPTKLFMKDEHYKTIIKNINLYKEKDYYSEFVYIITDNKSAERRINDMNYKKVLKNSGINIEVISNKDITYDIMFYQGIIDAMEKKLLEYEEENKLLKEKLCEYEK